MSHRQGVGLLSPLQYFLLNSFGTKFIYENLWDECLKKKNGKKEKIS